MDLSTGRAESEYVFWDRPVLASSEVDMDATLNIKYRFVYEVAEVGWKQK
jgi:hypothetical protein